MIGHGVSAGLRKQDGKPDLKQSSGCAVLSGNSLCARRHLVSQLGMHAATMHVLRLGYSCVGPLARALNSACGTGAPELRGEQQVGTKCSLLRRMPIDTARVAVLDCRS